MIDQIVTLTAQQGVAFAVLVGVIVVLARRVIQLETRIDGLIDERHETMKEVIIVIKDATEAIKRTIKNV